MKWWALVWMLFVINGTIGVGVYMFMDRKNHIKSWARNGQSYIRYFGRALFACQLWPAVLFFYYF